ncbi:MAG: hypothetical protein ACK5C4_06695 [Pseudanabaena sp.]|jgi:hypothetical protein
MGINIKAKNVEGNFVDGNNSGVITYKKKHLDSDDLSLEVNNLLTQLAAKYPNTNENNRLILLKCELEERVKQDPSFQKRFLSAGKAGAIELVKVLTNNPFVSIPLETVRGWLES